MPPEPEIPPFREAVAPPIVVPRPRYRWYHKLAALLFIVFCLELGTFLLIFPWSEWWELNFFGSLVPEWHRYWDSSYLRGAVSGLGAVNLYISLVEIFRLRRFAKS